jgi:hypothetical protein
MTKKEREQLRNALHLLWVEDKLDTAMIILCRLAGVDSSRFEMVRKLEPISLAEIIKREEEAG